MDEEASRKRLSAGLDFDQEDDDASTVTPEAKRQRQSGGGPPPAGGTQRSQRNSLPIVAYRRTSAAQQARTQHVATGATAAVPQLPEPTASAELEEVQRRAEGLEQYGKLHESQGDLMDELISLASLRITWEHLVRCRVGKLVYALSKNDRLPSDARITCQRLVERWKAVVKAHANDGS
eukprot:TRINITY_DN101817_c0_g1_i1.p1 TRINITY_DN101817_c0_g1~~TRINITY_DN101817_c0_g1_i1.p1  ORF type:complete len:179 (+),score=28.64 TRINITY_DN101817_c0_g1_i1:126-662(+)